jgi:hypothetical protein
MNRRNLVVPIALGLALLLLWVLWPLLRPAVEDRTREHVSPPGTVEPTGNYPLQFGAPDEWLVAGAKAETYQEALSGVGLRTGDGDVYLGQSPPDGPYLPMYVVGRAYMSWDTSALPVGAEILSATLVVNLPAGGGWEKPFDVGIYRGTWTPPLDLEDWQSPGGEAVGRWHLPASRAEEREQVRTGQGLTLYAPEPARTVRVALDPAVVDLAGVTRLELRHAGESTPPATANLILLGRSMIALEVEYRP